MGLPRIRLHDLRHTAASLFYRQGIRIEVISKILGHSSIAVTQEIYLHIMGAALGEATDSLDRLWG